jgi:hypothetical protein
MDAARDSGIAVNQRAISVARLFASLRARSLSAAALRESGTVPRFLRRDEMAWARLGVPARKRRLESFGLCVMADRREKWGGDAAMLRPLLCRLRVYRA